MARTAAGDARLWVLAALVLAFAAGRAQAAPFVYVTNEAGASVSQYDATSGPLVPLTPPTVAAGLGPFGVAISPDGGSLYIADDGAGAVSQYDIGSDGTLSAKTPATVGAGIAPSALAMSPDGTSAYATNQVSGSLSQSWWCASRASA